MEKIKWEVTLAKKGTLMEKFQRRRTDLVSEMFDESKKDEFFLKYGIYNTSKLYAQLDESFTELLEQHKREVLSEYTEEVVGTLEHQIKTETDFMESQAKRNIMRSVIATMEYIKNNFLKV